MNIEKFEFIIKFLQGSLTAVAFVGFFYLFYQYMWISLKYAFAISFLFFIAIYLIIVFLQYIIIKIELLKEAREQTEILKDIYSKLE